ncbi:MAG: hypothetical protein LWW93_06935 [Hyphomicrobiales bacterium]|nr:hypothetical protein [Hyphomicrobiales bacterium]
MKPKFLVGQEVVWAQPPSNRLQRCTVIRVMPVESASRTYRIKGAGESCERSVSEESLSEIRRSERDRVFAN